MTSDSVNPDHNKRKFPDNYILPPTYQTLSIEKGKLDTHPKIFYNIEY